MIPNEHSPSARSGAKGLCCSPAIQTELKSQTKIEK